MTPARGSTALVDGRSPPTLTVMTALLPVAGGTVSGTASAAGSTALVSGWVEEGGGSVVVVVSATFGSSAANGVPPTVPSRCTTESATTWPDTSASISHRRGRGEQAAGERLRHDDGLRVDDVPHDVGPGRGVDRDRTVEEHLPAVAVDVDHQRALLGRRGIDGDAADLGQVGGVDRPDARTVAITCRQVHVGAGQAGAGDGAAVGRRRRQRGLQLGERAAPGGEVGEDATEGALERARRGDGLRLLRPVGAELGIGGDVGAGGQHGHAAVDRGRLGRTDLADEQAGVIADRQPAGGAAEPDRAADQQADGRLVELRRAASA